MIRKYLNFIASGGIWLTLNLGLYIVLAFGITVLLTRTFSLEDYGNFQFIGAALSLAAIFSLPGLRRAISEAAARGKDASLMQGVKASLKSGVIGSLALLLVSGYYFWQGNSELAILLAIIGVLFVVYNPFLLIGGYQVGKEQFKRIFIYTCWIYGSQFITVLLVALLTKNLSYVILAYVGSVIISSFFSYKFISRKIPKDATDPEVVSYGIKLTLVDVIKSIAAQIDKIILFSLLSPAALAVYAVALIIPENILMFFNKVSTPLVFKKLTTTKQADVFKVLKRYLPLLVLGLLVMVVVLWYLLPIVIPLFFGENYQDAIWYSKILLFIIPPVFFVELFVGLMQAKKKVSSLFWFNTIISIIKIIAYLIAIPVWGILGAIVIRLTTRILALPLSLILVQRSKQQKTHNQSS